VICVASDAELKIGVDTTPFQAGARKEEGERQGVKAAMTSRRHA